MAPTNKREQETDPIDLDGRTLEGGGQLIRMALCLSALTATPIRITNIRGNRSGGGGLKAQHLACVKWLAHATNAHVEGAEKGSTTLLFRPTKSKPRELSPAFTKKTLEDGKEAYDARLEIGTAGSTGLALQAILPWILFYEFPEALPVRLTLSGGTNVSGSPSYEYITTVLFPTLAQIGFPPITPTLHKRGWSQGGSSIGSFTLLIPRRPTLSLPTFTHAPHSTPSSTPQPSHVKAIFIAPTTTHPRLRTHLPQTLSKHFPSLPPDDLEITTEPSLSEKRLYLLLTATFPSPTPHTLATDWLYDRRIRSLDRSTTELVEHTTASLAKECSSGAWVDEHLRDQLVIFQSLAKGRCEVYPGREDGGEGELREPSLHARTAEWVARQMLGVRFDSQGVCDGVGFGEKGVVEALAKGLEGVSLD